MADQSYVFDNAWQRGRARLDAVEAFLDPGTIRALEGLGVAPGWRCLELGAGGGSIAAWLSSRVGPAGKVVATDLDTRYVAERADAANIEIRRQDIVADPLEASAFDLVHARLVLEHIPQRDAVLAKLTRSLRPGGWLMLEAVDYVSGVPVSELGAAEHARSQDVRLRAFGAAGLKADYGRHLPRLMRAAGLVEIGNEGRVFVMEGGSPGARWFQLSMEQVRDRLVGPERLSDAEVDRMLGLFADPEWAALSPIILAAWGRAA
ncbi:MAG: putative methyltransferase [Rhodospirillales bacterium]|jgi:SAM-dependent methyltransferase|nr:putative methyltransferase [Rhodospirillales bacterium]